MILFAEPDRQKMIMNSLKDFLHVPFKFENSGSEIIFHSVFYEPVAETGIQPATVGTPIRTQEKAKPKIVEVKKSRGTLIKIG